MSNKTNHSKKQFCPKGHDTFVVGRYKDYRCNMMKKNFSQDDFLQKVTDIYKNKAI